MHLRRVRVKNGLKWLGRLKNVLRVGGENVASAEVEEVLFAHPAVETVQVVGVPDARERGESDRPGRGALRELGLRESPRA